MSGERLLIVEDERITAEDLRDILTQLGYVVVSIVSTGIAAMAEVEQKTPELVLMDIRIQGALDGTETARILRERFDTPVVFLTAHADEETLLRAKVAEPLGYVVKPFQESELRATLEMALHKNQAELARKANKVGSRPLSIRSGKE
jgi:CheY-like chemotaxis protein